jgi:hypothetical protein
MANTVSSRDGSVKCFEANDYFVTRSVGPCKSFSPPKPISLGQSFMVDGKQEIIGYIRFNRINEDMPDLGLKTGDTTCVITNGSGFSPNQNSGSGFWLYVSNCLVEN